LNQSILIISGYATMAMVLVMANFIFVYSFLMMVISIFLILVCGALALHEFQKLIEKKEIKK